jgi:hypothetical protein
MEAFETKQVGDYTVGIFQDEVGESPREWANMGTMILQHRRYSMPWESKEILKTTNRDEIEAWLDKHAKVWLRVWGYDHSGFSMKTGERTYPFNCPWDSGLLGWVYCTAKTIKHEYRVKRNADITPEIIDKVKYNLQCEVTTYGQYVNGEVYGFTVQDKNGDTIESCGGFYSVDDCMQEALACVPKEQELPLAYG